MKRGDVVDNIKSALRLISKLNSQDYFGLHGHITGFLRKPNVRDNFKLVEFWRRVNHIMELYYTGVHGAIGPNYQWIFEEGKIPGMVTKFDFTDHRSAPALNLILAPKHLLRDAIDWIRDGPFRGAKPLKQQRWARALRITKAASPSQ